MHRWQLMLVSMAVALVMHAGPSVPLFAQSATDSPDGDGTRHSGNCLDDNFAPQRLVAWCIVPFDARQRSPRERVEMLQRLGLRRVAYDWRAEHVASFEEEILEYQRHRIEFFAFWDWHDAFAPLVRKHGIRPQFWITNPSPDAQTQADRVDAAVEQLLPRAKQVLALNCTLGLYNHGGWGGESENLIAVCRGLRARLDSDAVGIVYNFHHGHADIADFANAFSRMQPYLLCVNINGMDDAAAANDPARKILPVGQGSHERAMLRVIEQSGYCGPIGIIDHTPTTDSEETLRGSLLGLSKIRAERKP